MQNPNFNNSNQSQGSQGQSRIIGFEYEHQLNSFDGTAYIITALAREVHRVEKVCRKCQRTDDTVQGRWGPIYDAPGRFGRMSYQPVLLCMDCYKAECEAS